MLLKLLSKYSNSISVGYQPGIVTSLLIDKLIMVTFVYKLSHTLLVVGVYFLIFKKFIHIDSNFFLIRLWILEIFIFL